MACVLCDCFKLDCTSGCADFNFILDGNPVLAEETGDYELYYEQTGQVPKTVLLPFTIDDPIVFSGSLFSSIGLVKFQLTSPTSLIFEYTAPNAMVYTCFQFERRYVQGNSSNSNQIATQLCTLCDVITAIQGIIAGGDASAENQLLEIAELQVIKDNQINGNQIVNANVTNQISGFATQTTLAAVQSLISALNSIQTNALNKLNLIEISDSSIVTQTQISANELVDLNDNIGITSDVVAVSDIANASHFAFLKRICVNLTTLLTELQLKSDLSETQPTSNSNIDVALSTRNLEATQLLIKTAIDAINAKLPSTLGQKTMANSLAVTIASDQTKVNVTATPATTPTLTAITPSTSLNNGSEVLVAADATRKSLTILNQTNRVIFIRFGAAVANPTTGCSLSLAAGAGYNFNEANDPQTKLEMRYSIVQATATGTINITTTT